MISLGGVHMVMVGVVMMGGGDWPLLQHYAVVDSTEGQVFIAVYHDINNTNLYLSEEEGLEYSLSLFQIISPSEDEWVGQYPQFDVHVVGVVIVMGWG